MIIIENTFDEKNNILQDDVTVLEELIKGGANFNIVTKVSSFLAKAYNSVLICSYCLIYYYLIF